jgi:hypothetical protein
MDDDELGTVERPAPGVGRGTGTPRQLTPHPTVRGSAACDICGALRTRAYRHPNPLRSGVVLYRCHHHKGPRWVQEDPKAAPGGGRYR